MRKESGVERMSGADHEEPSVLNRHPKFVQKAAEGASFHRVQKHS